MVMPRSGALRQRMPARSTLMSAQIQNLPVSLERSSIQPRNDQLTAHNPRRQKEGRLGPVPFHRIAEGPVNLSARNVPAVLFRLHLNARPAHGLQRHADITRRFQRRGQTDNAVLPAERQGQ